MRYMKGRQVFLSQGVERRLPALGIRVELVPERRQSGCLRLELRERAGAGEAEGLPHSIQQTDLGLPVQRFLQCLG